MPFTLEYRNTGLLTFSLTRDATEGTLVLHNDYDILKANVPYNGDGILYTFPENHFSLYTFKIHIPEGSETTCPGQPVTLSLSLSVKGDSNWLSGAMTAYCGSSTLKTRPSRIMRLTGRYEEIKGP